MQRKERALCGLLGGIRSALVAYSGGVDSTYLIYVARRVLGEKVAAVTVASALLPRRELEAAVERARRMGVRHEVVHIDVLGDDAFRANPPQRCYICKRRVFGRLIELAEEWGLDEVLDGTNADDAADFRPGTKAAQELGVRSPLVECGIGKADVRRLSKRAGLETWNAPSAACLASRVPYGTPLDEATLARIDRAEQAIRGLGFSMVRLRHHGDVARIELGPEEMARALAEGTKDVIVRAAAEAGYTYAALDMTGYRTGSLNEALGRDPAGICEPREKTTRPTGHEGERESR